MALINKSKLRDFVELSVSEEVAIELEKKVEDLLKRAEERAKANFRRTIFARDI
jgi:histone H3/H4